MLPKEVEMDSSVM